MTTFNAMLVMYRKEKKFLFTCTTVTKALESIKKCADRVNLHHASRENSHNTSSYIRRFRTRYGRPITIPICTLLTVRLICTGNAQRLQFIVFAKCRRGWRRIIGADNNVDYVIGWIGVDV